MSLSNYECKVILGCIGCYFVDQEKIEQMKKYHDQEDWVNCGKVIGSCNYPFRLDIQSNDDGTMTCNTKELEQ